MKKRWLVASILALCLLLTGCGQTGESAGADHVSSAGQTAVSVAQEPERTESEAPQDEVDFGSAAESFTESPVESPMVTAETDGYPLFDFEKKTVALNSGYEMPVLDNM